MENNTAPQNNTRAFEKARLIYEARESLVAADLIDERDDLDEANFIDWYDRTIPEVRDIEILAGAMKVELARRRGEKIEAEGELRGRPENISHRETFSSNATRIQRSRDRLLHTQSAAVTAYVQEEAKAKRVPSIRGAAAAAGLAEAKGKPVNKVKLFEAHQKRIEQFNTDIFASLDRLADGVRRSDGKIINMISPIGMKNFVMRIRMLPWLRIDRTVEGTVFQIDEDLRAICEGNRRRPELSYRSIADFLRDLRAEIKYRRDDNNDKSR